MIPNESVDLVFSFDSLVHAEADVIEAYLTQLSQKLVLGGVGFIHHSNIGSYGRYFRLLERLPVSLRKQLARFGWVEGFDHWRAYSMTYRRFADLANNAGLMCISQELIPWSTRRMIDCISVFCRSSNSAPRKTSVFTNHSFDFDADRLKWSWDLLCEFGRQGR
jgi:hypothetical protein